jgi:hypothetical protein
MVLTSFRINIAKKTKRQKKAKKEEDKKCNEFLLQKQGGNGNQQRYEKTNIYPIQLWRRPTETEKEDDYFDLV